MTMAELIESYERHTKERSVCVEHNMGTKVVGDEFYHGVWNTVEGWEGFIPLPVLFTIPDSTRIISEVTCMSDWDRERTVPSIDRIANIVYNKYVDPIHLFRFDEGLDKWQR